MLTVPVTAAQPTTGGSAPAAPPMTMFCGVERFSRALQRDSESCGKEVRGALGLGDGFKISESLSYHGLCLLSGLIRVVSEHGS